MKRKKPTDNEEVVEQGAAATESIPPEELNSRVTKLREDISCIYSSMIIASARLERSQSAIKNYLTAKADAITPAEKALFDNHFQLIENHTNFFTTELKKTSEQAFSLSDIADKLWPCKSSEYYDFEDAAVDLPSVDLLAKASQYHSNE